MKIFLLTPIYATTTEGAGATPVVHYFAKEWVKLGHEVYVYNLRAKFPSLYYWVGKRFQHQINNKLGMLIPTEMPHDEKYEAEGVKVQCVCLKKFKPHSEYSPSEINRAVEAISEGCRIYGVPDVFIGHWENPQLEVLNRLKSMFDRPTALVLHTNIFNLAANVVSGLKHIDYLGFRNINSQKDFESKYFKPKNSFMAAKGVGGIPCPSARGGVMPLWGAALLARGERGNQSTVMASAGQAPAQAPQETQALSSTLALSPSNLIAPTGQVPSQAPQPRHFSASIFAAMAGFSRCMCFFLGGGGGFPRGRQCRRGGPTRFTRKPRDSGWALGGLPGSRSIRQGSMPPLGRRIKGN